MDNQLRYNLKKFIGQAVKQLRDDAGLTHEELAYYSGKGEKYISKIERGEVKNITLDTLSDISSGLQTVPSDLIAIAEKLERDCED